MRQQFLSRDLFMLENAPPGGGVPIVTLPIGPVVTPPGVTVPTPVLPSPPSPILPTPGIEIADAFQFDEAFLGNPGSPEEALDLLGYVPFENSESPFQNYGGSGGGFTQEHYWEDRIIWCGVNDHGDVACDL
jgi:hypothetical protein